MVAATAPSGPARTAHGPKSTSPRATAAADASTVTRVSPMRCRVPFSSTDWCRASCPHTPTPPGSKSAPGSTPATRTSTTDAPVGTNSVCPACSTRAGTSPRTSSDEQRSRLGDGPGMGRGGGPSPTGFTRSSRRPYNPALYEPDVRGSIGLLADRSPGVPCGPSWTPPTPFFFDTQDQNDVLGEVGARMHWRCPDPIRPNWASGGRVQAYWHHTPSPACPRICRAQLPLPPTGGRCPPWPRSGSPRPRAAGSTSRPCPDIRGHAQQEVRP